MNIDCPDSLPRGFQQQKHAETRLENANRHPVCQSLPYPTPSAMSLWNQNILSVLKATRLPNDSKFQFHDFTTQLLQLVTPRLQQSVKTVPHDWRSVENALSVLWERYQYLKLSKAERNKMSSPPPRPLKILVMGGSLLVGTNCRKLLTDLGLSFRLPKRDCTWSNRLHQFLNSYADENLVQVTKVAMGGTNTATGSIIWEYDLVPEEARNPDIVLNAYSTNDMHILTVMEAQSSNVTLRDKVFDMTQTFVRQVLHTCDPDQAPPLLLHVDDYLGNEQRNIWDTTELSQGVQVLANYYGFATFSYSDVVRDIVYGDSKESWLSSNWWASGSYGREIHPGMGMHIASTWVTVYNLLHLATTFCSMPTVPKGYDLNQYNPEFMGLPALKGGVPQADNKPKQPPRGLPPALTKELLLEDVTQLWQKEAQNVPPCDSEKLQRGHGHAKCPFAWVSGLSLQQNNETWIEEYFHKQAIKWEDWKLGKDGGKIGFVPISEERRTNATSTEMILEFEFQQTIRSVTLFFMKSYGPNWRNSRLRFQVWSGSNNPSSATWLDERHVLGVHDKNTSEMYTEAIALPRPVSSQNKLMISASLTDGRRFKLMGLAVCS